MGSNALQGVEQKAARRTSMSRRPYSLWLQASSDKLWHKYGTNVSIIRYKTIGALRWTCTAQQEQHAAHHAWQAAPT